ncbi:MAG: TetR/AcrR family transcriptional regulator [bacterium]|nr:TetR/AcrR family transcriptional regulator [bacterium]MCP5069180.1 TetR/AcrR family transcriptional regulator [bacterium]
MKPTGPEVPLTQPASNQIQRGADTHAGESRETILDTAEALFARHGYEGVGLREIARLAQLSKSALFHHFPTKMDLYLAVLARIFGDLEGCLSEASSSEGSALARLLAWVDAMLDALAERDTRAPLLMRTLFEGEVLEHDSDTPEVNGPLKRILEAVSSLLHEGIEAGDLRPIPVPHATQSLIGVLLFHFASGGFGDEILGRPVFSATEIRRHKEFVLSFIETGLSARPNHPQGALGS